MNRVLHTLVALLGGALGSLSSVAAQVPQGYYVFGTFGSAGQKGLFLVHPRAPATPITVTGLTGDLLTSGSSCVLYRPFDGAIVCAERVQPNSSVDVHVIELNGTHVLRDASFSVGTGGSCCGEIPQMGLLADGRIVLVATDVAAGPLSLYKTTSYGYQGVGILDTASGKLDAVPISNGASIVDVFNGLAVARDGKTVYLGTYVSATRGDVWRVTLPTGGPATLVGSVPAGLSNMAFDNFGQLWITTLDATQGLFRMDVSNGKAVQVTQSNGALNGICNESTTGNFAVVSSSGGSPSRSIFWMETSGKDHLLSSPGLATPSGIAIHLNPGRFGRGTPTTSASFDWELAPNAGGLPEVGNTNFALVVSQIGGIPASQTVSVLATARLATPLTLLGTEIWVDLTRPHVLTFHGSGLRHTLPLGIPALSSLTGIELFVQTLHHEPVEGHGASPAVMFTVL